MGKFRKKSEKEVPEINTGSMSDIIFMFLFFFMVITNMRDASVKVNLTMPKASEIQKLEKKSLVANIYIGAPLDKRYGTEPRVQLNDAIINDNKVSEEIKSFVDGERGAKAEADRNQITYSLKVDKNVKMRIVTDIKMELRNNNALKINYATLKKSEH